MNSTKAERDETRYAIKARALYSNENNEMIHLQLYTRYRVENLTKRKIDWKKSINCKLWANAL